MLLQKASLFSTMSPHCFIDGRVSLTIGSHSLSKAELDYVAITGELLMLTCALEK